ncbi:unnamed protein product [Pleuronectes platessa]|uniref:Uncharacterized protein n=1 Tax=Pleuronectes platessa TaxID=8262 RepID=A0A9N7U4B7_PLEPL|nr:unnamed protein product [Pleuronectes platessa]
MVCGTPQNCVPKINYLTILTTFSPSYSTSPVSSSVLLLLCQARSLASDPGRESKSSSKKNNREKDEAWAEGWSQSPQCLAWKVLSLERLERTTSWEPQRQSAALIRALGSLTLKGHLSELSIAGWQEK